MDKYRLCIKGKNPEYFLRKVIDRKVNIYELERHSKELYLTVDVDGYKKIKKIKTSYEIYVVSVTGLLKIKEVFNKYFFFILFFCMGICLNIFLSTVIFKVEVVHSNKYIRELVYNDLKEFGISKFKFKVSFDEKEKIVKEILNKEKNDIEWLEIEEVGTKYIVKVEQRKLNSQEEVCNNRNIVAKKNATILEIYADSGEVVKKKLDYVLKDDVIISGVIHNKEDIVSNKCAVGKVYGEVWYKVEVELPTEYHEVNVTGKSNYRIEFNFLDKKFILFGGYDTYKKNSIINLENKLLPVSLSFSEYLETTEKSIYYTLDNSEEYALEMAEDRLMKQLNEDEVVLSKKVLKKQLKKSKIIVEVFLKVKEDITSYKDIVIDEASEDGDG